MTKNKTPTKTLSVFFKKITIAKIPITVPPAVILLLIQKFFHSTGK